MALRRFAARSDGGRPGPVAGGGPGLRSGMQGHLGLAVDLLFGWIVAVLAAATVVSFGASIAPADAPPSPRTVVASERSPELGEDLDPRDPLVLCTVFVTHTKCAREES